MQILIKIGCKSPLRICSASSIIHRYLSTRPSRRKFKSEKRLAQAFVDVCRVRVIGGKGGNGSMSFLSMPRKEWAGPDGGDGGNGGHVIFQADGSVKSLGDIRSLYHGATGENGRSKNCHGKNAMHTVLKVPIGTIFRNENGELLCELSEEEAIFIGARGGGGGKGNYFFLSNENRAPTVYEEGGVGEDVLLYGELRVMADVGLVGFPNAGKSTLLQAISRAKPKVAPYPFTTLRPHVGIVEYENEQQLAVADIPGLISGAHKNYGLGFAFLRHISHCQGLLYVLDMTDESPWERFQELQYELEQYESGLSQRPHAIVANKMDREEAQQTLPKLITEINNTVPIFPISAKKKINVKPLLSHLRQYFNETESES